MKVGRSYKQHDVEGSWDAIVIGSGMGGLSVAALLARHAGKRVLVLERHYTAGGLTHTFTRPGYEWDVGLHYVGDVHRPGTLLQRVFDHLTEGELQWADMGEVYDTIVIGSDRYELMSGRKAFRRRMAEYFPAQRGAIDRYLERIQLTVQKSRNFFLEKALPPALASLVGPLLRWPALREARRTVAQVMSELTDDMRLVGVLTGQYGDYGLPPSRASFFMHAMLAQHYLGGAAYPVGGAGRVAATIAPVIERTGGSVVTSAEVAAVIVDQNRAVGVRLADGNELFAPVIVSDAGWTTTFGRLVPPEVAARIHRPATLPGVAPSLAHLSLYVGVRESDATLGLKRSNQWIYPHHDHDQNVARYLADPEGPLPVVYLSFPSAKDPDFGRRYPGRSTIEAIGFAPYAWFSAWEKTRWMHRGAEYEAMKQRLTDRLLEVLIRQCPTLDGKIEHVELSTPLSTRHFAGHQQGEIYGLDHSPARFEARELKPRTPLAGLYLTGADVCVAGVGGAAMGGVLAASVITQQNLLKTILRS